MKALILASGIAKRLKPLTNNIPKCLVKVKNRPLLDIHLTELAAAGIQEIIITTGPHEKILQDFLEPYRRNLSIQTIKNEVYDKTNYIFSIYRAKKVLSDDILLLHGDLIFSQEVLQKLLASKNENRVIVRKADHPEKDFKARINHNRIYEISTKLRGLDSHFLAPLYLFSHKSFQHWLQQIDTFVKADKVHCYAEDALNQLLEKEIELNPVYIDNEDLCMEIDDPEDLQEAGEKYSQYLTLKRGKKEAPEPE